VLYPLSYGANEPCGALNDGAVPPSTHSQFDPTAGLLACSIGTKKRQGRAVTFYPGRCFQASAHPRKGVLIVRGSTYNVGGITFPFAANQHKD
jgi:hypothetical protein